MRCGRGRSRTVGRAHKLIFEKLPKRTRTILALPEAERKKVIRNRKKLLEARAGVPASEEAKQARPVQHQRGTEKEGREEIAVGNRLRPVRVCCD